MPNPLEYYVNQVNQDALVDSVHETARLLYLYYASLLESGFNVQEAMTLTAALQVFLFANAGNIGEADE